MGTKAGIESNASFFRNTERLAFVSSSAGMALEVLLVVVGVAALIVALALQTMPADAPFWGAELLGLGGGFGLAAGLSWWLERRPSRREALDRVDDWFELQGALVTAWELECGTVSAPSFQNALKVRVARALGDKKQIVRGAFALTLPILLVPLGGAAVLAGVQEERSEAAKVLEARAATLGTGSDAAATAPVIASADQGAKDENAAQDLGEMADLEPGPAAEIAELQAMQAQLKEAEPASDSSNKDALGPEAKAQLQERIAERIAELEALAPGETESGEPESGDGEGSNPANGAGNGSNEARESASVVTDDPDQGRIRAFQGISPTGAWWPERQDEIVRSWLLRLEGASEARD